jgi:integrase
MVDTCDAATYQGQRDRALLLFGFAGAMRRSELVALDVAHLKVSEEGFIVTIAKSKTDQEGQGQTIAIPRVSDSPYCPVQAVIDWMAVAGIEQDALFRRVTKGRAGRVDRKPVCGAQFTERLFNQCRGGILSGSSVPV